MRSRYHVDNKTIAEMQKIVSIVEKGALTCSGEIHPSDNAPVAVLFGNGNGLRIQIEIIANLLPVDSGH